MKFKKLIISIALVASGCTLNENLKEVPRVEYQTYSLVASFGKDQTRAAIQDEYGTMAWNAPDSIIVFGDSDPEGAKFVTAAGGKTALFQGEMKGPSTSYIALYPYSDDASLISNTLLTHIPEQQKAFSGTFDPSSFVGLGITTTLDSVQFSNLCGGIRFSVSRDDITSVVFRGNNGELISGEVRINLSDATLECTDKGNTEVCLSSDSPLTIGAFYFITIVPQCLEKGFTMEFHTSGGETVTVECNVPVYIRQSIFSTINNADSEEEIGKILDGIDLSKNGCANCYVVSKPGFYKFPNRDAKGELITNAKFAVVMWETDNTAEAIHAHTLIDTIAFKKEYIYFHAADRGDGQSLREGNAQIAIISELGTVLWTWHIWLCEDFNPYDYSSSVLDRNLGALAEGSTSSGLLYQWGRKEPFMGRCDTPSNNQTAATVALFTAVSSSETSGTALYSQRYPKAFITSSLDWLYTADNERWGNAKTVNDPCPAGWRIPSSAELEGILNSVSIPLCGYLNNSFVLTGAGSEAYLWTFEASAGATRPVKALSVSASKKEIVTLDNARGRGYSVRCVADN